MTRRVRRVRQLVTVLTVAIAAVGSPVLATATAQEPTERRAATGELPERRTRSSSTIRNADGTLTTTLHAGAVHYRDASGAWQPIRSEIVEDRHDGFAFRNAANGFTARWKDTLDGEYLAFDAGGVEFRVAAQGAARAAARKEARGVSYANAVGGVELRYDMLADGVKETLVLPDASAPTRYSFTLRATGDRQVSVARRSDGSWAFFVDAALSPAFVLDAPVALDASGPRQAAPQAKRNATLDVRQAGREFRLDLSVDGAWLRAPERRFPVELDPTITIQPPIEDVSFPPTCPGCVPYVSDKVFMGTDTSHAWRGAVQFNLAEIPEGADVTSAELGLYWGVSCITVPTAWCNGTSHQVDAHRATAGWSTTTVASQFTHDPAPLGSVTVSGSTAMWMTWPVTTTLREWLAAANPNFGVILKRSTEPLGASGPVAYGRRYAEPSLQPKLTVTYPGDGVNLLPPDTLHSNGAFLRWTPYPSTATVPFSKYEIHRSASASFVPSATTLLTTISDAAVTSFRDTTAAPNRTFTYKVVTGAVASTGRTVTLPATGQATKLLQPSAGTGQSTTAVYSTTLVNCANYGSEPTIWIGPGSTTNSRGLVKFDLRDVPETATITSASMSLWHAYKVELPVTVRAYAATAEWREGTGLSTCTKDGATWYDAYGGVQWANLGTDTDGVEIAAVTSPVDDPAGFDTFDVTTAVRKWVSGAQANHGVMLKADDEVTGNSAKLHSYYSDDFAVAPSLRPKLAVTYADGSAAIAPTMAVAAPGAGTAVSGTVTITASASDDRRVDKVEFLVDGVVVATDTSAPFARAWSTTSVADGAHSLVVRGTDDAGNVASSPAVSVTVDNSAAPTVSVTGPALPPIGTYAAAVQADAPRAWWRLGDPAGSTTAVDSAGTHVGTYTGVTTGVAGATKDGNTAARFSGVNGASEVKVPHAATLDFGTGDFTAETWVKTGVNGEGALIGKHATAGVPSWRVTVTDDAGFVGRVRAVLVDAAGTKTAYGPPIRVDDNAWHHVVVAYDRDRGFVVTVDGIAQETLADLRASVTNAYDLRIGDFSDYPALAADIDEVALYPHLLSADRVRAHLDAGRQSRLTAPTTYDAAVKTDAPLGYWRLGEVSGTTAADSSGNNRHGTHVGTPTLGVNGPLTRDGDGAIQVNAGSHDYVSVPRDGAYDLNGSFTIEWWGSGQPTQPSSYPGFLRYGGGSSVGDGWMIYWTAAKGAMAFKRDNVTYTAGNGAVTTGWRHYALTYDEVAATLTWYVDGLPTMTHTGVTWTDGADDTPALRIGSSDTASAARIDETAIYATALSADRIRAHYDASRVSVPVVSGTTTISANAADDRGVTKVEFLVDGVRVGEDTVAPYSVPWNTLDGANPVYDGTRIVTAVAHDAAKSTTSASWPVRVDNTRAEAIVDTTPPPVAVVSGSTETAGVEATITNTGDAVLSGAGTSVNYRWISNDPTPVVVDGTPVTLGTDLAIGAARKVRLDVKPPTLPEGVGRADYTLRVDVRDSSGAYAASRGNKPKENPVQVAKALEDALGLERWYQYRGEELGAGMQHLVNVANGNSLWRWTPFSSPGRGLTTNLDLTYNSLEKHSNSPAGNNVSISISSLTRLGLPLDIHPNKADTISGRANRYVVFTDGDGTSHRFDGTLAADGTVWWASPPGVHLYLRSLTGDPNRTWALTRPDRVTYYYDADGFPTSIEDNNGNKITYTVEPIPPGEDGGPVKKRVTAITDAAGSVATPAPNRTFRIDYYSKAEVKKQQVRGRIQRITDHNGSALDFEYYDDGNLRKLIQRGGTTADGAFLPDRWFVFTYITSNGEGPAIPDPALRVDPDPRTPNQGVLLYSVRDPRGTETRFDYYGPGTAQLRDRLESMTNRAGAVTTYGYDLVARRTTVTAPLSRVTSYLYDTLGRVTSFTNPMNETTALTWNADNKVTRVTEPNGVFVSYTYNDNGYFTSTTDQVGNQTILDYDNLPVDGNDVAGKWQAGRTIPHISQLRFKTNPNGVPTPEADYRYEFVYDAKGNLIAVVDPLGHRTSMVINGDGTVRSETSPNGGVTSYVYDANGLPIRITDPVGRVATSFYDEDGLLRWRQDGRHQQYSGGDPREYRTYFDYDSFHRMGRQSMPKSTEVERGTLIWSGAQFDPNDNVTLDVDSHYGKQYAPGSAFRVTRTYDAMDQPALTTTSDTSADPLGERTKYEHDLAGRLVKSIAPRGMQSATIPNDFVTELFYDNLDRVVREKRDEVDAAGVVKSSQNTWKCYAVNTGDLTRLVLARANRTVNPCADLTAKPDHKYTYDAAHRLLSQTDGNGNVTSRAYDRNSNVISVTDAAKTVKRLEYNQRDERTRIVQPFVGGTTPRDIVTKYEYDKNGNRVAVISPRAWDASPDKVTFTQYVTRHVFDPANQLTRTDLPSTGTADAGYVHRRYDNAGFLTLQTQPVREADLVNVAADKKTEYTHFDPGWIKTENDNVNPRVHYDYTAHGRQASRTPQKKGSNDLNISERQRWTYYDDGQLRERADEGGQKVTYTYDASNNLLTVRDSAGVTSNGQKTTEVVNTYDGLDRNDVSKARRGSDNWKVTTFGYNLHGEVDYREDNREESPTGTLVKAGRKSRFVYDNADWMQQQTDEGDDRVANTSDDQRILNSFYPTGWERTRTIQRLVSGVWQTKQTTDWTHYLNGSLKTLVTKNGSGTVLESHDVSYIDALNRYVNGHKTRDVFTRSGGATCTTTCTQTHEYDARDRVTREFNGSTTTSYDLDPAGNVLSETSNGVTTTYTYKGNQIDTQTSGGVTAKYNYDSRGNLDCVTTGATSCASGTTADYSYDYLDRMTSFTAPGESATYEYDALDRLAEQRETHSGVSRATSLSYLGTTGAVTSEEHRGSPGGPVNRTKSYSYDAFGNSIGMTDKQGTSSKDYNYGYDVSGNVSQLNDATTGTTFAAYGYKPYGDQDTGLSKGDTDLKNPVNPVRFMAKRFDTGSGTVDMGARRFGPRDNHFLQEDRMAGALGNMGLSQDPLTSNRYSLAGGNPTSFVEVDGHWSIGDLFGGGSKDGNPIDSIRKKGKNFFNKARRTIKEGADKVAGFAKDVSQRARNSVKEVGVSDVASEVAGEAGDILTENASQIARGVGKAGEAVGNFAEDTIENGAEKVSKWARSGKSSIKKAGRAVARWGADGGIGDTIEDKVRGAGNAVSSKWVNRAGELLDKGSTAFDFFSGVGSQLKADADEAMGGLEKAARATARGVAEAGGGAIGGKLGAAGAVAACGIAGVATGGLAMAGCAVAGGIAGGLAGGAVGDFVADLGLGDD